MNLTSLTAAVDFASVETALLAVGAAIAAVYVGWKGIKLVLRGIRSA
jgi:hypothetical protein